MGGDYTVEIIEMLKCEKVNGLKSWPVKFRLAQEEKIRYCQIVEYKGQYDAIILEKEFFGSTFD